MKRYSMLKVLIKHPIKTFIFWYMFLLLEILFILPENELGKTFLYQTTPGKVIIYGLPVLTALFILKRHYNRRIRKYERKGMVAPKEKTLFGFLWNTTKKSYAASCRRQRAVEGTVGNVVNGFIRASREEEARYQAERRAREQEQNQKARARWDARNNQKKAEWDARDAMLRGKDIAARNYSYQADYWKKESKKY